MVQAARRQPDSGAGRHWDSRSTTTAAAAEAELGDGVEAVIGFLAERKAEMASIGGPYPWLLCPGAREEAARTGLVYRCEGRANHRCTGERTPYLWSARGPDGQVFEAEEPHCGSCESDDEYSGRIRGDDEECCCVHDEEWTRRFGQAAKP
jgi:hypothetical protein